MHPLFRFLLLCLIAGFAGAPLAAQSAFTSVPSQAHYVLLVINPDFGRAKELSGVIARYHADRPDYGSLDIRPIRLIRQPEVLAIQVTGFTDERTALLYTDRLERYQPDLVREHMVDEYYPISQSNFNELYRRQDLEGYLLFARRRYDKTE